MKNEPNKECQMNEQDKKTPVDTSTKPPNSTPEIGGAPGPEPTRYGDWEKKGRCIDF